MELMSLVGLAAPFGRSTPQTSVTLQREAGVPARPICVPSHPRGRHKVASLVQFEALWPWYLTSVLANDRQQDKAEDTNAASHRRRLEPEGASSDRGGPWANSDRPSPPTRSNPPNNGIDTCRRHRMPR